MAQVDVLALEKRSVLILGGGVAGLAAVRELRESFNVILVDAKAACSVLFKPL